MTGKALGAGRPATLKRRRLRRRLSAAVLLLIGLAVRGRPCGHPDADSRRWPSPTSRASALLRTGKQLFDTSCVTCHGANLQGVADRGPSLIGVGEAAVYFQVSTGRMPAMRGEAQAPQKPPHLRRGADRRARRLRAGQRRRPAGRPATPTAPIAQQSLLGDDVARGGDLFRLNCASCHNFTGKGGALSSGKYAPDLTNAEPAQIYTAMLTGPQNMPKFSDRQLVPGREARHRRLRADGRRGARPRRLRPRRFRTAPRGHGHLDHRDCGRHRRWPCGSEPDVMSDDIKGSGHAHRRRTGVDVPRGAARARRQDSTASRSSTRKSAGRYRAPRPRSAPNARWRIGFCWAAFRASHCCWSSCSGRGSTRARRHRAHWWYDLATPLYGVTFGAVDPGHRHRRGAVPEEVHPRRDLHPGPPRRQLPRAPAQDHRGQPDRRSGRLDHQAAQADRAVARHRSRRFRRWAHWSRSSAA